MNHHGLRAAFAWSVLLAGVVMAAPTGVVAVNELADGIAPGVVRANDAFGTSTVVVPQNGYVTYFVRGAPNLAGTPVQFWTNTSGEWVLTTTRSFDADGTAHFFARVSGRTGFQARIPGTPGGSARGRSAANWPVGDARATHTRISINCDDFTPDDFGRVDSSVLVARTAAIKSGTQLDVVLCSNASTGFEWEQAVLDSAHLELLGHRYVNTSDFVGAPGTETWSFLVRGHGAGHGVLAYSRPFAGGEKGTWIFVLTTLS